MALYRCGLRSDCPYADVVHLAGKEFPKFSEKLHGDGFDGGSERIKGAVHDLSDEDVAAIKQAAARKVFQPTVGKAARAQLRVKGARGYVKKANESALTEWVYLERLSANPWHEDEPASLADLETTSKKVGK